MAYLILAEANMYLGNEREARKHAKEVLKIDMGFSLEELCRLSFYKDPSYLEGRLDTLRKAGLN